MRLLLFAFLVFSLRYVDAAQVSLYKDQNFRGPELALEESVHDLSRVNFHDQVSSIVVRSGAWEVCTQPSFQGECAVLPAGTYPALPTLLNHRIESIREAPSYAKNSERKGAQGNGHALVFFSAPGFMGKSQETDQEAVAVVETAFGAPPRSLVVREGTWQACTEPGYQGVCRIFRPGRYRDLQSDAQPVASLRRITEAR